MTFSEYMDFRLTEALYGIGIVALVFCLMWLFYEAKEIWNNWRK